LTGAAGGSEPRRRALRLAYDGTRFAGWQVQPGLPTVQGEVESALERLCGAPVRITGAGRTDAGVHALGQVAHFDDPRGVPVDRLARALNTLLPDDVRVLAAAAVPTDFHARHEARCKTYAYQIHVPGGRGQPPGRAQLPCHRRLAWHAVPGALDLAAMRRAAACLTGTHDFTALSRRMDDGRTTVRTLHAVRVLRAPHGVRIVATGDGFLYGMMRLMAGLLVDVGSGRRAPADVPALLEARDRTRAPPSLPPQALCLLHVRYARPSRVIW